MKSKLLSPIIWSFIGGVASFLLCSSMVYAALPRGAFSVHSTSAASIKHRFLKCSKKTRIARRSKRRGRSRVVRYAKGLPPRYAHRWDSRCRIFGLSRKACFTATRKRNIRSIHKMIMHILLWWQRKLDTTSLRRLRWIQRRRNAYFHVSRWWWDRYRRDRQFWAMDVVDRMLQPVLSQYPSKQYKEILQNAVMLLSHKALSRPREVGLLSRLSRWLKRRPDPNTIRTLISHFSNEIFREKKCHWWSVVFIATFSPEKIKEIGPKMKPSWCKYRRLYLQSKYRMPSEINSVLKRLHHKYRRITRLQKVGTSSEGRAIWALKIGKVRDVDAPTTLLVGSQHGDEHMGAELLTHYANQLLRRYHKGEAQVRTWMRTRQIWIIPIVNPDGYRFDLLGGVIKWWRYNRKVQSNGEIGVDLNRNWDFKWKKYNYYRSGRIELPGTKAFSEPETKALARLTWRIRKLTGILDVHQSGAVVLTPWAFTRSALPGVYRRLFYRIGRYLTAINHYRVWPARHLYPHQATLGDWGFGRHKVISLVLELGRSVYVNLRQKKKIFRENKVLLDRFVHLAIDPFRMIRSVYRHRRRTLNRSN